jgi:CRISPR-associated exonuclease Cas4
MEPILISALAHWSYCPRRCGLIHLESVWDENVFTLKGTDLHERADQTITRSERGVRVERALPLWSESLGVTGRADVVEFHPSGSILPIEYKSSAQKDEEEDPHSRIQLCAQAMCLEEMLGAQIEQGAIYYIASRHRVAVPMDQALRAETLRVIEEVREALSRESLPSAPYSPRCPKCSLFDACLPKARQNLVELRSPNIFRPQPEAELP